MRLTLVAAAIAAAAVAVAGCGGTTGSHLVTFTASVAGRDAGDVLTASGWRVTLSRARLHVGAVYLNATRPISGAQENPCILGGQYVGQIFGGLDVDLLDATPRPFPAPGDGTANLAATAQVWLSGGDINADHDDTPILDVAGEAMRAFEVRPFRGVVTISDNRKTGAPNAAQPGLNPICQQRIVVDNFLPGQELRLSDGTALAVTVDVPQIFGNVDFALLPTDGVIRDGPDGIGGRLYSGIYNANAFLFQLHPQEK